MGCIYIIHWINIGNVISNVVPLVRARRLVIKLLECSKHCYIEGF